MSGHNKNIDILKHMAGYCREVEETLASFDGDFETFRGSHIYQNACSMCVLQIGELAKHLTPEFTETYDEIPWRVIRAMRNRFAHDYVHTDIHLLWNTLTMDIPALQSFCEKVIRQYQALDAQSLKLRDE